MTSFNAITPETEDESLSIWIYVWMCMLDVCMYCHRYVYMRLHVYVKMARVLLRKRFKLYMPTISVGICMLDVCMCMNMAVWIRVDCARKNFYLHFSSCMSHREAKNMHIPTLMIDLYSLNLFLGSLTFLRAGLASLTHVRTTYVGL